ncbi:MAG: hypothetical protein ACLGIA_06690 [Actinomycetes bacterium]
MNPLPEAGVNFPLEGGRRATTGTGKRICADAVRGLDDALAARILAEPDWRHRYPEHLGDLALVEARSAEAALDVARAGMRSAHEQFVVVTDSGDVPLDAIGPAAGTLGTAEVAGSGERQRELTVPYRGRLLQGDELLRQLADWVRRGITEPSFGEAVGAVVRHPDWLDVSDRCFAVLGAGAQMGPFSQLLSWGARVAAVDLPRAGTWQRLIAQARSSAGTMLVPTRDGTTDSDERLAEVAGADLITQVADLEAWLATVPGPLTLGNYGYVDGAGFVRLSMAFDALFTRLAGRRDDLSLAYLATPSDVFLVPREAVRMAEQRYRRRSPAILAAKAVYRASGSRYLRPNYTGGSTPEAGDFALVNAIIPAQGPNYAVAKRLQRWRMLLARADGLLTSVHVAPPTRTRSVHSNPLMEERQRLTELIGIETFDAETSQALAAAILVHDLRNPEAPANPATRLVHPHQIFMHAANPGGRWRVPLEPASSLEPLRVVSRMRERLPFRGDGRRGDDSD